MGAQLATAAKALSAATERYNALEESAALETHQLRRDNQEFENLLRRKDEELQRKKQSASTELQVKAARQLQLATEQVEKLKADLTRSGQKQIGLATELETFKLQHTVVVEDLRVELSDLSRQMREQAFELAKAQKSVEERDMNLQLAANRLRASVEEVERQKTQLVHQENQLALLESKLSRSIPVDDEEMQRRRQHDESNWNQRLAALEHALAAEKQTMSLLKEQQRTSISIEREKAAHAVARAKAVAEELEVANLCLAERKKQREQEKKAFDDEKQELRDRITSLAKEIESLQRQSANSEEVGNRKCLEFEIDRLSEQLRIARHETETIQREARKRVEEVAEQTKKIQLEYEASRKVEMEQEISKHKSAASLAERAELEVRHALETLMEERDFLAHKVQSMERATPRSTSALSETRVELQKAKQKIAVLEEKLARGDTSRSKDVEGKIAQLSARERRSAEEQK